jgi:hypothetical protein
VGYVLLWIENLAVSLLLIAAIIACVARIRRRWLRLASWIPFAFFVFLAYLALTILTGYLKFVLLPDSVWFYSALALMISYVVGVICLRIVGLNPKTDEPEIIPAATWPRGKLALAFGVAVALHLMTLWNMDLEAREQLASLRAEAGAMALSAAPPRVPDSDNAALIYEQADEALTSALRGIADEHMKKTTEHEQSSMEREQNSSIGQTGYSKWINLDSADFDPSDPELVGFLKKQSGIIALILEGAKKPSYYFEHDYNLPSYSILLPEVQSARNIARLLALQARWKAATGDYRASMEDINAMFAIAQHIGEEPFIVSGFVGVAIDGIAMDTLRAIIASHQLDLKDLDIVKLHSFSYQKFLQRAFRFEDAFWQVAFLETCNNLDYLQSLDNLNSKGRTSNNFFGAAFLFRIFLMKNEIKANRWYSEKVSNLAVFPYYQTKDEWRTLFKTTGKEAPKSLFAPKLCSIISNSAESITRGDAQRRIVELALAMCRYRAKNGKYPEKLDELVPDFIAFVPLDPFDGKPMRLKKTDGKIVIYSIGTDGIDDGGTPFDPETRKGDITFELPNK